MYLKVVPIIISHGSKSLRTYTILDDGAERTIILPAAVLHLELKGEAESLALRTIRHEASLTQPSEQHLVTGAFTAGCLALSE